MKRIAIIIFTAYILVFCVNINAQTTKHICDNVNCTGNCGKYIDDDQDGYCDFGIKLENKNIDTISQNMTLSSVDDVPNDNGINNNFIHKTIQQYLVNYQNHFNVLPVLRLNIKKRSYNLIEIGATTIILYLLSWILSKNKVISKRLHKRIWNLLLLISFLVSCLLGILLIIQINYDFPHKVLYNDFLYWHVQIGIVMVLIGIFHALWHIPYFKKIFSPIE
ncbi:MAG: hypothetical protein WBL11_07615 [Bacteroidales bacterium]|mgnify:CR=1 FL=1|jgi:hypothetical protein|nr:hypothetical protein [Bacteroidales bacterium]MDI9576131.1 hypothetical protein [Bacteroidota bacterium]MDD2593972.1 hypothetical protein [Bacteroidales bacterium]MDD3754823.1 hypothetical protein [Bacteroidales bacterium]MDY0400137.1 hypothetical protein [Bacteroidales bacterium]